MVMEQMCQQLLSKEVRRFIDSRNPMLTGSESNVGRNGRYEVRKSYYRSFAVRPSLACARSISHINALTCRMVLYLTSAAYLIGHASSSQIQNE